MQQVNSTFKISLPIARIERLKLIKDIFSNNRGPDLNDDWAGGRAEALRRLAKIKPISYSKNRNFLDGDVTRLSPYIRHGCISIAEAIKATKEKANSGAEKLLFEFAWRDYWRKVWYLNGFGIDSDMEHPKVELKREALPQDVKDASTGLVCIDHFVQTLEQSGYLHNHARMWLASYIIHWRGADWKVSADWMFKMLLDGDRASNNLSWQWVASTFGSKPYFYNKENLSKYSENQFCQKCNVKCPFDRSYEALGEQLFKPTSAPAKIHKKTELPKYQKKLGSDTVVLFYDEMLSSTNSLYGSEHRKVFVFDTAMQNDWAVKRLQFIADCLVEMPDIEIWVGNTAEVLSTLNIKNIITQNTPNLMLKSLITDYDVLYVAELEPYSDELAQKITSKDLRRFSKYWNVVGSEILKSLD